jgi:hypothetical protein
MKKYLNGCSFGCKNKSAIVDYNKPVYDAIREKYPKGQIIEVYARYGEEDQARYCRLRHLDKIPGACDVKKYKTMIYMVTTDSTDSQPQGEYYDIITICPPPRECNKADTLRHL